MTATKKQGRGRRGGATGKGFQPGQSGNPGGRPKSLVNAIRAAVGDDGDKLIQLWSLLAFAKDDQIRQYFGTRAKIRLRDRLDAAKELADRGYGRPVQTVELGGPEGGPIPLHHDLSRVSERDLETMRRILSKAHG